MRIGNKFKRIICFYLAITLLFEVIFPTAAFALTEGPTQPEMQGFTPVGTSDMVDVFSGDFKYNIPLMDVGGYPINISYSAGQGMDAEASWVGLGWSLVPGNINRNMRGLPDDFKKDDVEKTLNMKPNLTYGINAGGDLEFAELPLFQLSVGVGLSYNNYNGYGFMMSANPAITAGGPNKGNMTYGLGLSAGSESGVGIQPSVSYSKRIEDEKGNYNSTNAKIGLGFNSRAGLTELSISGSKSKGTVETVKNYRGEEKKRDKETEGQNGKSSISFASPSYVPASGKNFLNVNLSVKAKFGSALFFVDGSGYLSGSFSGQFLVDKHEHNEGYGYMYMHKAKLNSLMDFNREKDGAVGPNTPNLPLASASYDVYSVSGQGIGGMYRPFRSDLPVVHDKELGSLSGTLGVDVGLEFGVGNLAKFGANASVNASFSNNGAWLADNAFYAAHQLHELIDNDLGIRPAFEPFYFKQAGEKTAETDMDFFNKQGGFSAVRVDLTDMWGIDFAKSNFITEQGQNISVATKMERTKRARRNEVINPLNVDQAKTVAHIKNIENYPVNSFVFSTSGNYKDRLTPGAFSPSSTPLVDQSYLRAVHPGHHISEISAFRADGARYVYGIPAYNKVQEEATFNVSGRSLDCSNGLVNYSAGVDDTENNSRGTDNYYEMTKTPKYAHSYLLTEILSADYVDLTDNGPTDDDLGNYTKINYSKVHDNFKWRTPYEKANYSEGSLSNNQDDKGSYVYGEKEIWYLHSIETKNFVAEFHVSSRADAKGVAGKQGGKGTDNNYKLDKIVLYSKQDKLIEANDPTHQHVATPVKTVDFTYDYSLCKNVNNNDNTGSDYANSGKLTLKSISFTYGNSNQGKLSPYTFVYADKDHDGTSEAAANPDYNMKAYDRWGNYQPTPGGTDFCVANTNGELTTARPANNAEFPYTNQYNNSGGTGYVADDYAWAWNLSTIQLPSGGQINVDYEADDYAFVQDKKAMQMFKVMGAGASPAYSNNNLLYQSPPLYGAGQINNHLYFNVDKAYTSDEFRHKFLEDENGNFIQYMYFKFLMKVNRNDDQGHTGNLYEYVPGYVELGDASGDYGMCTGSSTQAFIKVKSVEIQDKALNFSVNAISQAGWNYARQYAPRLAFAQSDITDPGLDQIFESMASTLKSLASLVEGMNNTLKNKNSCQQFETGRSFMRLYNPSLVKKGGGYRVKRLKLLDNWKALTTPNVSGTNLNKDAEYGQEYNYTTEDVYGTTISSGVASYEPGIGGDENPWKQPVFFEKKNLLVANDAYYQEEPYGESFFPSPGVGYSKVTVKNLQYNNVTRRATGKIVHEFYTAKDFPTLVNRTEVEAKRFNPSPILQLLNIGSRDFFAASQGYVIELNDMHGKPKAEWVYQEGKLEAMTGTEYKYKQQSGKHLDNNVLTISKTGKIEETMVGVDYDMTVDMRESISESYGYSTDGNAETCVFGLVPVPLPLMLLLVANEKVRSRLSTVTKVVNRYGILESTTAFDQGARVTTANKLFDAETGEVLATQTTNQFSDNVYSFNYPAHWRYDGMGGAYKNIGITLDQGFYGLTSTLYQANYSKYLVPGDELLVETGSGSEKAWVKDVSPLALQRADGTSISNYQSLTVIRSGRRNQQSISIGSLTSKKQPWYQDAGGYHLNINAGIDIINAGAVELTDETKIYCECLDPNQPHNDYVVGLKGNWRQARSYTYLTDRSQTRANDNLNIRTDGIFTAFTPFYTPAGGSDQYPLNWNQNTSNWTWVNEVSIFSPFGNELENKDALNRYSSALFGYSNSLPLAVSSMAKYNQIAYDGFEDYDFKACQNDHLGFRLNNSSAVRQSNSNWQKYSHTGKRSIKVSNGSSKSVTKTLNKCDAQNVSN